MCILFQCLKSVGGSGKCVPDEQGKLHLQFLILEASPPMRGMPKKYIRIKGEPIYNASKLLHRLLIRL